MDRRSWFGSIMFGGSTAMMNPFDNNNVANAQVFFDPAQYGDQELRVSAVDSVREATRRAILQNPKLAPAFYQLALLDGLSFQEKTQKFGPDGKIVVAVLSSKTNDEYTQNLQAACLALIEAEKTLRRKTAISLADAIAIAGAEAIESIGGPILPVQLGRADTPRDGIISDLPIDLFAGNKSNQEIRTAFQNAGITEREMTALLAALLTLEKVEKTRTTEDWRQSTKPKFREPGKMGRMSEFRPITEEDIAQAELEAELEDEPDDGWYIADSFGSKDDRFGQRLAKDVINEKNFNKYLKEVVSSNNNTGKKKSNEPTSTTTASNEFGWTADLLLDPNIPTAQMWLNKYAAGNLAYIKDLAIAYNSITQLGAVYTGGKYENLLKNRPRKSLNDDGLNLFWYREKEKEKKKKITQQWIHNLNERKRVFF